MTVVEFEQAVWEHENIRIVARAPAGTQVQDYDYEIRARHYWMVAMWTRDRRNHFLDGLEVVVLDGRMEEANSRSKLDTVRSTYSA